MQKLILSTLLVLLMPTVLNAAYLYVDGGDHEAGVTWDDTDGHSYTSSAEGFPGAGTGYNTIQAAINACSSGDTIYMRGGTYSEYEIDIPEAKGGIDNDHHTKLSSYPGEWAILDPGAQTNVNVISNVAHGLWPNDNNEGYLQYFTFERFEVTGSGVENGFYMKTDNCKFRYLYVHDCKYTLGDGLKAGMFNFIPKNTTIEYCSFVDNENGTGAAGNNSNIIFDADQRDSTGEGRAFDATAAIVNNTVRYNYISGSKQAFRHKNQQRFGYNSRNPNDRTYQDYGDKIHHNIALGASIIPCQDYAQVYNNITNAGIHTQPYDAPIVYNNVIYNNTVMANGWTGAFACPSGMTDTGSTAWNNYYDDGGVKNIHNHWWYYNNISVAAGPNNSYDYPFVIYYGIPGNSETYNWDASDIVLERNLANENQRSTFASTGRDYLETGCPGTTKTVSAFNDCSNTWRGVSDVVNWDVDNSVGNTLFSGSGADAYIANSTFVISGATTIANGGYNAAHPYLSGVTIPDYIGATDPDDITTNNWVDGLLNDLTSTTWLASTTTDRDENDDPTWIADSDGSSPSTPSITGVLTGSIR